MEVPADFHDMFEKQTFAHVSTILPDGSPHVTPVWIDYDEEAGHLLFNTARGRRKERNLRQNPDIAVSMTDPDDPYQFLSVQGEAVELTEDGAVEHINALAQRYMNVEEYPNLDSEEGARVIVRIQPETVVTS